jgi:hypothetical protein
MEQFHGGHGLSTGSQHQKGDYSKRKETTRVEVASISSGSKIDGHIINK